MATTFAPDFLDALTSPQREAVEHINGPLLVLAGPGSGKTRVVTSRVANLLRHGVSARNILALTFTNKAADEMRRRIEQLAPREPVWISTFHRFCARLLRTHGPLVGLPEHFTIYDTSDSRSVLKRVLDELNIEAGHFTPDQLASAISRAKNQLLTPEHYEPRPGHALGHFVSRVYPAYQARLLASGAVDFDDLLMHVAVLLRENSDLRAQLDERYRYVLVDEYQDTNLAQYAIVRGLSIDHQNLAVTGDPDQSIYGWRGAQLSNILDFEHDYPGVRVVRLERNYRSTQRILAVADHLITYNVRRKPKRLYTENEEGRPVTLTMFPSHKAEAEAIVASISEAIRSGRRQAKDFAVFFRVNALSRSFEFALREQALPFQLIQGVEFFQRKEIKDLLAYMQLLANPCDDVALLRIINTPPRDIGRKTIDKIVEYANGRGQTLLDAARESGVIPSLSKRAAVAVAKFVSMIDRLTVSVHLPVEELLRHVLKETRYREQFEDSELEEDQDRVANIDELLTAASEFDERDTARTGLEGFLEQSSLVNDTDGWEANDDRVTLMTLHAAKGLEFPVVYIIGLEEGLLPHDRSRHNPDQLEEERRLFFVGITRAEKELHLSFAREREVRGQWRCVVPSSFLMELPRAEMEILEPSWARAPNPGQAPPLDDDSAHDGIDEFDHSQFDDEWSGDASDRPLVRPSARSIAPETNGGGVKLMTGADLAGETADAPADQDRLPADAFAAGMLVRHPIYGVGTILEMSVAGSYHTAVVDFSAEIGRKKFMLEKSRLRPVDAR